MHRGGAGDAGRRAGRPQGPAEGAQAARAGAEPRKAATRLSRQFPAVCFAVCRQPCVQEAQSENSSGQHRCRAARDHSCAHAAARVGGRFGRGRAPGGGVERDFGRLVGRSRRGGWCSRRRGGSCTAVFLASGAAVAASCCCFVLATGFVPFPVSGAVHPARRRATRPGAVHLARRRATRSVLEDSGLRDASRRGRGSNFGRFYRGHRAFALRSC